MSVLHFFGTDVNDPQAISALLGGFILLFGFVSLIVKEKLFLSESLVATLVGIAFGPVAINLVNLGATRSELELQTITRQFSQLLIAIQVMAAGVAIPGSFWIKRWKSLAILLGPTMLYMWLSTALVLWLVMRVGWVDALLMAACAAPTDPVLANSIVSGRFADLHIPMNVRNLLAAESAANDGLAVPLFGLAMLLLEYPVGESFGKWIYYSWLYQVGVGTIVGILIGYTSRVALRFAETKQFIDKRSFLSFEIALAAFTLGVTSMIEVAAFLAVFVAGVSFAWDGWFTEETEAAHVQEVIDMLFNLTFFLYFGSIIPWASFNTPTVPFWRLMVSAIAILILRRLPAIFVLYRWIPHIFSYTEAIMIGWFGPMGVGALWYMSLANKLFPENEVYVPIVTFLVFCSVVIYGITAPFIHFTVLTISTLSRTVEMRVPTWPANVPFNINSISSPIVRVEQAESIQAVDPQISPDGSVMEQPKDDAAEASAATLNDEEMGMANGDIPSSGDGANNTTSTHSHSSSSSLKPQSPSDPKTDDDNDDWGIPLRSVVSLSVDGTGRIGTNQSGNGLTVRFADSVRDPADSGGSGEGGRDLGGRKGSRVSLRSFL
ncbi:hypothetical protein HK104_004717 [Borealophlyctis nickersoniae]|nr:hypothetical protein HK104_004717 [Borealophlyctis nickersoniae]